MRQVWVLQGRVRLYEWHDLHVARRVADLPRVKPDVAKLLDAEYRVIQQEA